MYSAKTKPEKRTTAVNPKNIRVPLERVSEAEHKKFDAASREMRKGKYISLKKAISILVK